MGRTLTMTEGLRAGRWLRVVSLMGLLLMIAGGRTAMAQAVTTTNEVRAMRGLEPIGGSEPLASSH